VDGDTARSGDLVANPQFTASNTGADGMPLDEEVVNRIREEQREALAWSSQQRSPLYFGPCNGAEAIVRGIWGNSVRSVNISGFSEETVNVDPNSDEEEENNDNNVVVVAAEPEQNSRPSTSYGTPGVAHDTSCGGDYVLGSVYNASGQLVQAVAVVYNDDFGNRNYAAAVNGAYRFPISAAGNAHNIYISLVDATGNPVSATVTVPHRQGGASDLGCHYVIWQGID
jgi:hypothetical protein